MALVISLLLLVPPGLAGSACGDLLPAERARAEAVMASVHPHDCCDGTLAECLQQAPRCRLADRLAADVCRRVAGGQPDGAILQALRQRAWTMIPYGGPAVFDLANAPVAGDPEAPVQLVVYASPLGTHCQRMVPPVYAAVTSGPLQGKVRLLVRPFPLRSTPHDTEAGLALLAAHAEGRFWDLALRTYAGVAAFDPVLQRGWAGELGLDLATFDARVADPALLDALKASKREGVELGVTATPTFYIDGRPYRGELEVDALVDVLEEVWERTTGRIYVEEGGP